jgi:hypothetical protein
VSRAKDRNKEVRHVILSRTGISLVIEKWYFKRAWPYHAVTIQSDTAYRSYSRPKYGSPANETVVTRLRDSKLAPFTRCIAYLIPSDARHTLYPFFSRPVSLYSSQHLPQWTLIT